MEIHPSNFFGTDGIRTRVGEYPLTNEGLPKLGYAIGHWARSLTSTLPRILLVRDTRASCAFIQAALTSGLLSSDVVVDDGGVLPTPAAHVALQSGEYDCALIITASHNPYQDNGVKILSARTNKISRSDQEQIINTLVTHETVIDYAHLGAMKQRTDLGQLYKNTISPFFDTCFLAGKTIILDCANGATSSLAVEVFEHFGAIVHAIHAQPNGSNINAACGAVYPEQLASTVVRLQADAGFAFDGDGDRIIAVNKRGEIKNGDDILYLLSSHPQYAACSRLVSSVMANQALEIILGKNQKTLIRTPVGDKHIADALVTHEAVLGAEPSGHVILKDHVMSSDGIFTALRVMEALALSNNDLMETFEKMPHILLNVPVAHKKDLTSPELASIINQYMRQLNAGRLLVRYSGTENLLRIMVEDTVYDHAYGIAHNLSMKLSTLLI